MTKKEKILMDYIFDKANGKESVLIAVEDVVRFVGENFSGVDRDEVDQLMQNLVLDRYITLIMSDKKGKPIYCISLDKKGESWVRDNENKKRTTIMLVVRTVLLAVLSFVVGVVLKAIFS